MVLYFQTFLGQATTGRLGSPIWSPHVFRTNCLIRWKLELGNYPKKLRSLKTFQIIYLMKDLHLFMVVDLSWKARCPIQQCVEFIQTGELLPKRKCQNKQKMDLKPWFIPLKASCELWGWRNISSTLRPGITFGHKIYLKCSQIWSQSQPKDQETHVRPHLNPAITGW